MMRRSRGRGNGHGGNNPNTGNGGGGSSQPRRSGGGGGAPNRHQVFDSNGPDVRIRGNAWQVYDKYQALARDAQTSGDRVKAENYLQHAEHYYRIILAVQEAMGESAPQRPRPEEMTDAEAGQSQEAEVVMPQQMQQQPDPAQMPQPTIDSYDTLQTEDAAVVA